MIRTAFSIGAAALLLGIGVLLYRHNQASGQDLAENGAGGPRNEDPRTPAQPRKILEPATQGDVFGTSRTPFQEPRLTPDARLQPPLPGVQQTVPGGPPQNPQLPPLFPAQPGALGAGGTAAGGPGNGQPASSEVAAVTVARTHVVKPGDSLWAICRQYYGSAKFVKKVAQFNGMEGSATLRPGQILQLPQEQGLPKPPPPDADHETPGPAVAREQERKKELAAPAEEGGTERLEPMAPTLSKEVLAPMEADLP